MSINTCTPSDVSPNNSNVRDNIERAISANVRDNATRHISECPGQRSAHCHRILPPVRADPPNEWRKGHELLAAQRQTRVAHDPPTDASRWMAEREPAHLSEIGQETMAGDDDA